MGSMLGIGVEFKSKHLLVSNSHCHSSVVKQV